ncbi:MAG TPA: O-antigen ligase family protein [Gaiellaceae bacterium]
MAGPVALAVYAALLVVAAAVVWRRPALALYAFVVGLAAHNAVMAALYAAGVHGTALTVISAWKEILLAVALVRVATDAVRARRLPFRPALVDWLALSFGALAVVYALVPQAALDGEAGRKAVALGLRHDLVPVAAFFLGRSLRLGVVELRRLGWTLLGTATAVAAVGLVDVYAVPIGWWRTNGVVAYFHDHLGYDYHGTGEHPAQAGLPENFVYNVGGDRPFLRRLVSTFLSPLASSYLFVVALLVTAAALRRRRALPLVVVVAVGLLFTFSRSALLALALGLFVLALLRRRALPAVGAVATLAIAVGWAHVFPHIGPTGNWTKADLVYQHQLAEKHGEASGSALSANESSLSEHWRSLRDGVRTMLDHPQGYGLGNVGQTASRTDTTLKAGESNYTELGVELGVLGSLLWIAWGTALLAGLVRAARRVSPEAMWAAGLAAAFAAVLALAVQTDVIGDPWIAYCLWMLGGALLVPSPLRAPASIAARARASSSEGRLNPAK